jgi:hypothetical protein
MSLVQSGTRVPTSGEVSLSLQPPRLLGPEVVTSKIPSLNATIIPQAIDLTQTPSLPRTICSVTNTKHRHCVALLGRKKTNPKPVWLPIRQSLTTMQVIDYKALDSFEALPTIRDLLISGVNGFLLKNLPEISNNQANTLVSSPYVMRIIP